VDTWTIDLAANSPRLYCILNDHCPLAPLVGALFHRKNCTWRLVNHQWISKDSANQKKGDEIKSFRCDETPDYKIYSHALRSMFSPRLLARSRQSRVPTLCLVHRCSPRSGMLVMMARNY